MHEDGRGLVLNASHSRKWPKTVYTILIIEIAFACILTLAHSIAVTLLPLQIDFGEGHVVWHLLELWRCGVKCLYDKGLDINPYPIGYYVATLPLCAIFCHDPLSLLISCRLFNAMLTLLTALVLTFFVTKGRGHNEFIMSTTVAFILIVFIVSLTGAFYWNFLCRVDALEKLFLVIAVVSTYRLIKDFGLGSRRSATVWTVIATVAYASSLLTRPQGLSLTISILILILFKRDIPSELRKRLLAVSLLPLVVYALVADVIDLLTGGGYEWNVHVNVRLFERALTHVTNDWIRLTSFILSVVLNTIIEKPSLRMAVSVLIMLVLFRIVTYRRANSLNRALVHADTFILTWMITEILMSTVERFKPGAKVNYFLMVTWFMSTFTVWFLMEIAYMLSRRGHDTHLSLFVSLVLILMIAFVLSRDIIPNRLIIPLTGLENKMKTVNYLDLTRLTLCLSTKVFANNSICMFSENAMAMILSHRKPYEAFLSNFLPKEVLIRSFCDRIKHNSTVYLLLFEGSGSTRIGYNKIIKACMGTTELHIAKYKVASTEVVITILSKSKKKLEEALVLITRAIRYCKHYKFPHQGMMNLLLAIIYNSFYAVQAARLIIFMTLLISAYLLIAYLAAGEGTNRG